MSYDPRQRLYQVGSATTNIRFLYDGVDAIGEYDANGNVLRRYIHGPSEDDPIVQYEGAGLTNRRWLHTDEHDSVIATSDAGGNMLNINSYDEYGIPASSNSGRFQYTGQMWIPELGLYHYKARAYSPTLGRFLQTDPSGYDDGPNWYEYAHDDPINADDSSGLCDTRIASLCAAQDAAEEAQWGGVDAADPKKSQQSHVGLNGFPQAGPAPQMMVTGDTGAMMQDAIEENMVMQGLMSQQEHRERQIARGTGLLTGLAIEGGLEAEAGVAALGRGLNLVRNFAGKLVKIEGSGAGARYGVGRIGQIRFGGARLILRVDRPPRTGGVYHLNIESHTMKFNWHIPLNPLHWFGL